MSLVHNAILVVGSADWGSEQEAGLGIAELNRWLREDCPTCGSRQQLTEISAHAGTGPKACEVEIWAAGINYLDVDGFLAAFRAIQWINPDEVLLMVAPQEGSFEVYRPHGSTNWARP